LRENIERVVEMKKIALVIISMLLLSGLAYGQEVPEDGDLPPLK